MTKNISACPYGCDAFHTETDVCEACALKLKQAADKLKEQRWENDFGEADPRYPALIVGILQIGELENFLKDYGVYVSSLTSAPMVEGRIVSGYRAIVCHLNRPLSAYGEAVTMHGAVVNAFAKLVRNSGYEIIKKKGE